MEFRWCEQFRPVGIVAGIVIYVLSMISGCQKDRATAPAAKVEPPAETTPVVQPQASVPAETPTGEPGVGVAEPNEAEPPVSLVLGFSPGQTATYRVTTEAEKSVGWMGPESAKPADYSDGRSGNYVEMTFEQRVEQVRDNGNAVLGITIKALKYRGLIQNKVALEFDSSRAAGPEQSAGGADRQELSAGACRLRARSSRCSIWRRSGRPWRSARPPTAWP